jgi:hypothetical protein
MNYAFRHEFEAPLPPSLEVVLERDGELLEALAQPGRVLTKERLAAIEAAAGESLLPAVEEAEAAGLRWPDEATGMGVVSGGHIERHAEDEDSDEEFARAVMAAGGRAFNNFSAHLQSLPVQPAEGQAPAELFAAHPSMMTVIYGSKPYLWRAHLLVPDFMTALQYEAAAAEQGGMATWQDRVIQGAVDPEQHPHDAALLRASRIAYVLLTNLMRTDDLKLQYEWLAMGEAPEITDPERELWT